MTGIGDGQRKLKGVSWQSWVDRQIRDGIERGDFENLPGRGKPLDGIGAHGVESQRDEDWWLKAKLRRERLSYLPPTLAIRKELEEALEAVAVASREDVVRRIVGDINERIRDVNRRGSAARQPDAMRDEPSDGAHLSSPWLASQMDGRERAVALPTCPTSLVQWHSTPVSTRAATSSTGC